MIKTLRTKTRWIYHPVTIFLLIQVLWILVMVVWIRWYIEKHAQIREMAERLRAQADVDGLGWLPLIEGGVMLTLILVGATVIFIYWTKQHRLIQMQHAFVSNVTHELKSPVASIQLALETIVLRELSEEERREFLSMMLDDTERLAGLIDRILGAARIEKRRGRYTLEIVGMRHFLEDVLEQDRHLFEKDGHVVVLEGKGEVRVAIDRSAMRVVLSNLIENAARYSPRGSKIFVKLMRELGSCRIEIHDAGVGIARKDLKSVFKMFWRGSEGQSARPGGTGLGLYIVRNIVRDHGGKAWATSPGPGRGSTFMVRLPRFRRYWHLGARRNMKPQPEAVSRVK